MNGLRSKKAKRWAPFKVRGAWLIYKEGINKAANIVSQVGKTRFNVGFIEKSEKCERRALKYFPSYTQKHSIQIHSYNKITMPEDKLMIFGLALYSVWLAQYDFFLLAD